MISTAARIGFTMIATMQATPPAMAREPNSSQCSTFDAHGSGQPPSADCSRHPSDTSSTPSHNEAAFPSGLSFAKAIASSGPSQSPARIPSLILAQARGAANEDSAWETARNANTEDAYIRFLEEFPAGNHADQARQALDALSRPPPPRTEAPSRDLARDPPAATQPDPGARRPPPAPDPAPSPSVPPPAASPLAGKAFAWNYDERAGALTVTNNGKTQKCVVLNPSDYAGIGVYLSEGAPRVNFDRQRPGNRSSSGDLLFDAFCAEASNTIPTPPPSTSAPPPDRQEKSLYYTIRLCNKSSEASIDTAVAHYVNAEDNSVTVVGWWVIARGQCVNVRTSPFGRFDNMHYYTHANTAKFSWPGKSSSDLSLCTSSKAFSRKNTANYTCKSGEKLRNFKKVDISRSTQETVISTFSFND